jgi:phospholipase/carboxylesterase
MPQKSFVLGGLAGLSVGDPDTTRAVVVLHGREMSGADLAPFAEALQGEAFWLFPDAPLAAESGGRTWWPIDSEARIRAVEAGPLELSAMDPPGRAAARAQLGSLVAALPPDQPVVLAGFSQGGMLAMDYALHAAEAKSRAPAALALFSSTRIALADWLPRAAAIAGQRVLVAHGREDRELSFAAGEALRDFAITAGATVTWLPFEGGHELPFVVWRALKKLVRQI